MSVLTVPVPPQNPLHQFSVDEYHQMIRTGILDETDRVELLEGYVVDKMPHNPPHDGTIQLVQERLASRIPAGWCIRIQSAVTLSDSEPEPDLVVARGTSRTYLVHHPGPADVALVVEVADSSLSRDRDKARIYARADMALYWIINLLDRQVAEYAQPSGPTALPAYALPTTYRGGDKIRLVLDGITLGDLAVADLLP
jgi:Uma2 family endonuclease